MGPKTLILVDMQNDFFPGGTVAIPRANQIIPFVNLLQAKFQGIVAAQTWHPRNHKSFASTHYKKSGETILLNGLQQILWPDHCVENTIGAQLVRGLETRKINKIFKTGMDMEIDSFSGFYDNGHSKPSGLGEYLSGKKVQEIFIAGLATDYCVKNTALDAVMLGFKTTVIEDACRGMNLHEKDTQYALDEMRRKGVSIITSNLIFSEL
ncbi:MAG: bifunctional nicotinamidase/pyrazinamidase [Candidatus Omnitrophica bacterium]|nr:bifunctional nicotinamidase/pyrazinamidase [Candidatus Omnitrophota bacterium]